uniref:Uncharacterized protein n=1 Tax=Schizaphis graminum TaxID=13262 RepID=A0A2S2P0E6_SCHGA
MMKGDPRCLYGPTTTKNAEKSQKQSTPTRTLNFIRLVVVLHRCVCIVNERSLSNRYCALFVAVLVPGEIDGQVNDLSSALVSALLQRRLKNYMRFDRKKRS